MFPPRVSFVEGVNLQVIVAKDLAQCCPLCWLFQKTQLWETIITMDDKDYARCSLYYFWCNSDMWSLSDCIKMWTTCASFICSTRLRYALTDF